MTLTITDAVFQVCRVSSLHQHMFIIVRLQESSMTLLKMFYNIFASNANVRKYSNLYIITANNKTIGVTCVMEFWKGGNGKIAYLYGFIFFKRKNKLPLQSKARACKCAGCNING